MSPSVTGSHEVSMSVSACAPTAGNERNTPFRGGLLSHDLETIRTCLSMSSVSVCGWHCFCHTGVNRSEITD